MAASIGDIAQELKNSTKKVQLIYAFNGVGKTRLSREFKDLIAPKVDGYEEETNGTEVLQWRILSYNDSIEDLFYWENADVQDFECKLRIQRNILTDLILIDQGQDRNIITTFQRYTSEKITPQFIEEYITEKQGGRPTKVRVIPGVTFSIENSIDERINNVRISKGEESNFIWSVFYTLLVQVIAILDVDNPGNRETNQFDELEYVFIDDPVSSLDEGHLIELAVDVAELVKKASRLKLKFIITTHNPLFFNVLHHELNSIDNEKYKEYKTNQLEKYRLTKDHNGAYHLEKQKSDSPFSYHLFLLSELEKAVESGQLQKFHLSFLRNILEKTATFLGHENWGAFFSSLTGNENPYEKRIINFYNHSRHSGEETADLTGDDRELLLKVFNAIKGTFRFGEKKAVVENKK